MQSLIVDRTHLVLVSGKLVIQKAFILHFGTAPNEIPALCTLAELFELIKKFRISIQMKFLNLPPSCEIDRKKIPITKLPKKYFTVKYFLLPAKLRSVRSHV